ncbi:MAG: RNA polymerase sigma factor [Actinophytocola sp.]|uniref:RNA polymerase sigma factor n=1 Tax=Actinophytocola sp. TaxID=1872138 RepID=UPI003D6B740E
MTFVHDSAASAVGEGAAIAELVAGARARDSAAWREIFHRYDRSLWRIARAHGLHIQSCADVVQQTWLSAVSHLDALRDPEAFGAWLRSIARRESLRHIELRNREATEPRDFQSDADQPDVVAPLCAEVPGPEDETLRAEQQTLLTAAWRKLSMRDQVLLNQLMAEPRPSYSRISRSLGLPVGSIGPTRARCLARLRGELDTLGVHTRWSAA